MTTWEGQWIWCAQSDDISPRNQWQCFRKRFTLNDETEKNAILSLTADSRYVLHVNGKYLGNGPARSWQDQQFYDTYDISKYLLRGENVVSVLVMHYGVATFYYEKGRGGLIAQLDLSVNGNSTSIYTDSSWKTKICSGQDPRANRMACQQAFTEHIDGRLYNEDWTQIDYDDSDWCFAKEIGEVGMEPWTALIPRDIPMLVEEAVLPSKVDSLASYRACAYAVNIDVRTHMNPESIAHVQEVGWLGFIATCFYAEIETVAVLAFPQSYFNFGECWLNGQQCFSDVFDEDSGHRQFTVTLQQGKNVFIMDISGYDQGRGFHFAMDCAQPLRMFSMAEEQSETRWATLGPFDSTIKYNDGNDRNLDYTNQNYLETKKLIQHDNLFSLADMWKEISTKLVSNDNVFAKSIWKHDVKKKSVPVSMQAITSRMTVEVPKFTDYDTEIVLDFGKEWSGYIEFEIEANDGDIIDFYGYEYQYDGWRQDTYTLDNTMRYVCRDGRQAYRSKIRRGFRYLMVNVSAQSPVKLHRIQMIQSNYPVSEIGHFACDDELLNEIWLMGRRTLRICMEDTFVDCPSEQVYWVADARNEALINYYVYGNKEIVKRCLNLVPGSKKLTPFYTSQVPTGWTNVIPNFTFTWIISCYEYFGWTGDRGFVQTIWADIKYTLEHFLKKLDNRGLLLINGWNFLDWAPIDQPNDGTVTHQNAFFYRALLCAHQLAKLADDEEASEKYLCCSEKLRKAINQNLWDEKRKAYIDCIHYDNRRSDNFSIQTQIAVYGAGVSEDYHNKRLETYFSDCPEDFTKSGSPFISFFHYECLVKTDKYEDILNDIRRNYGMMLKRDAKTCWEMYPTEEKLKKKNVPLTRSHCHAWAAAPCYFLGAHILGVKGTEPGWESVVVAPNPSGLSWARGSVPLANGGKIDVSWEIVTSAETREEVIIIKVKSPENVSVDVVPPAGYLSEIYTESIESISGM